MVEYLICKEMGWTITDLEQQPVDRLEEFKTIINIKRQLGK